MSKPTRFPRASISTFTPSDGGTIHDPTSTSHRTRRRSTTGHELRRERGSPERRPVARVHPAIRGGNPRRIHYRIEALSAVLPAAQANWSNTVGPMRAEPPGDRPIRPCTRPAPRERLKASKPDSRPIRSNPTRSIRGRPRLQETVLASADDRASDPPSRAGMAPRDRVFVARTIALGTHR